MTLIEWLSSPLGQDLVHAIIGLLVAAAAYLSYLAHRRARVNTTLLEEHLDEHALTPTLTESPPGSNPAAQGTRAAAQPEGEDPGGAR